MIVVLIVVTISRLRDFRQDLAVNRIHRVTLDPHHRRDRHITVMSVVNTANLHAPHRHRDRLIAPERISTLDVLLHIRLRTVANLNPPHHRDHRIINVMDIASLNVNDLHHHRVHLFTVVEIANLNAHTTSSAMHLRHPRRETMISLDTIPKTCSM